MLIYKQVFNAETDTPSETWHFTDENGVTLSFSFYRVPAYADTLAGVAFYLWNEGDEEFILEWSSVGTAAWRHPEGNAESLFFGRLDGHLIDVNMHSNTRIVTEDGMPEVFSDAFNERVFYLQANGKPYALLGLFGAFVDTPRDTEPSVKLTTPIGHVFEYHLNTLVLEDWG